jgi:hypothetical protein
VRLGMCMDDTFVKVRGSEMAFRTWWELVFFNEIHCFITSFKTRHFSYNNWISATYSNEL